jgi:4-diphosphocytidyl-2-C-methyl-D-erythritol kinase
MIVFPNGKINLGLHILQKRSDGYHNLETIFYPIPLCDSLEIIDNTRGIRTPMFPFSSSGLEVAGNAYSNICVKAYKLLKKDFPNLASVKIHLHKIIPTGAGLGGGSSDAAFTLKAINDVMNLGISTEQLINYAAELGSDCAFFIINKPSFAKGRGEILEEIQLDLADYKIIVVNPGIHVDSGRAFLDMKPEHSEKSLKEIITGSIERWKDELKNDFEKTIFQQYKPIAEIKDKLYSMGAIYSSMSGSGSTVFGIFPKEQKLQLSFPDNYFVRELAG